MLKRQREIERMVADLGLKIGGFRTDGTNHWRVDIVAPNGRQRPFTFSNHGHDGGSRRHAEEGMVRRWRREVAPELEEAEKRGPVDPPTEMLSPLALELRDKVLPVRNAISTLKATEIIGGSPGSIPPFEKKRDTLTVNHKQEPSMQQEPAASPPTPTPRPQHYANADKMTQADVMRFYAWMNRERLDGFYSRAPFCAHATKALGFKVTDSVLLAWLEVNNMEMPRPPQAPKPPMEALNDDVAAIALALAEGISEEHRKALMEIVDRRTKR